MVRVLPETVANQIAAGEVVERPASVVKELVENALDAGATRIEVVVENGGAKRIEVDDNGCGMGREDALASLERQATSKIATSEDIVHISTFGFRGEAIPSIASVSRFSLVTRPAGQDAATALTVIGGTLEEVCEVGHPPGTTVTVSDLFFNVPARRKFLRAATTELARIRQSLTAIALAHPDKAFRLRTDGRDLFRLPAGDTLEDRVRRLLGEPTVEALLPVDGQFGDIHVSGLISKPDFVRGGTPEQYVFINHRPATAPQIQYALREAWPGRENRPLAVLFIDLPPEEVDVNVHPAKREVRFRHGTRIINAVMAAVSGSLGGTPPPCDEPASLPTTPQVAPPPPLASAPSILKPLPTPQAPPTRQQSLPFDSAAYTVPYQPPIMPAPLDPLEIPPLPPPGAKTPPPAPLQLPNEPTLPWKWSRVVELLPGDYWLVVTDQGYVTVDAKAALERILYERFAPEAANQAASQPLLLPETLRLPPADAERVQRFLPELEACGFDLTILEENTFLINAFPVALSELPPKEVLADLAIALDQTGVKKSLDAWRREVVARAAAKAAAGAAHPNSLEAVEKLIDQLAHCDMPYITPRGRPVMILTTYRELARRFQRSE